MYAQIPPNFFSIVNAIGFDQKVDIPVIFTGTGKMLGDAGSGELIEHFYPI